MKELIKIFKLELLIFINNFIIVLSLATGYDIIKTNPSLIGYITGTIVICYGLFLISKNIKIIINNIITLHFPHLNKKREDI
jgi:hypothetical protein